MVPTSEIKPVESLRSHLLEECARGGFPVSGVLDLDSVDLQPAIQTYDRWLSKGHAGEMQYLVRGRDRRANPKLVFPETESILAVALPYPSQPAGSLDPEKGVRYARYLRGEDYHEKIPKMLESVLLKVRDTSLFGESLRWKICVDSSALFERFWAANAGLGWIGKNSMLIHPQLGSYLLLGFALLNQRVHHGPTLLKDFCGSCTRCLGGCPTGALLENRELNSNRCISYWTLEKRGPLEITEEQKNKIGNWVAGCDLCQEVCPFNSKVTKKPFQSPSEPMQELDCTLVNDWASVFTEDEALYKQRTKLTALERIKYPDFQRNLKIAQSNQKPSG